nr:putative capsid [Marmot picobirnavirus]
MSKKQFQKAMKDLEQAGKVAKREGDKTGVNKRIKQQHRDKAQSRVDKSYKQSEQSRNDKFKEDSLGNPAPSNDIAWYSEDPALITAAGNFFYTWPIGHPINREYKYKRGATGAMNTWGNNDSQYDNMPGLMVFWTSPTFGQSTNSGSSLNLAAQQLYSFVRHLNSGSSNYDAPDLMLYVAAMSSVYSLINFLERIYGSVNLFTQKNRYFPKHLIECQGIDYNDLISNLASARYQLNVLINAASSFAVPSTIRYFFRQCFNFAGYYSEGTSIKDQIYFQAPAGYFKFEIDGDGAGRIAVKSTPMYINTVTAGSSQNRTLVKFSEMCAVVQELIDSLLASEDFGIMNGDILKAYGSENLMKLVAIEENYAVFPSYDEVVLEQFRNSTQMDLFADESLHELYGGVYQDKTKGYLLSDLFLGKHFGLDGDNSLNVKSMAHLYTLTGNTLLFSHKEEPTMADTIESTRLTTRLEDFTINNTSPQMTGNLVCGSDIVNRVEMVVLPAASFSNEASIIRCNHFFIDSYSGSNQDNMKQLKHMAWIKSFKYSPVLYAFYINSQSTGLDDILSQHPEITPIVDFDNFAVLSVDNIKRLHEACMLSLLHVATIAKIVTK